MQVSRKDLPPIIRDSEDSLITIIRSRHSVRTFQNKPLSDQLIGQLLWAAQGLRGQGSYRTVPSAGALYPLVLFCVCEQGLARYEPEDHTLIILNQGDLRDTLASAALDQDFIRTAGLTMILSAIPSRTSVKYGPERSPRYIDLEVGHSAQNAMLVATANGLGSVAVGAFYDDQVLSLIGPESELNPRYLVSFGHPA